MKNYFYSKLFDINYRIAIHEGNANQRLASEAPKILSVSGTGKARQSAPPPSAT